MNLELPEIVRDLAVAFSAADRRRPQAMNARSKVTFKPGIGPHSEAQTTKLIGEELESLSPELYSDRVHYDVPYPELPRQKCDLCFGTADRLDWAIEIKMLRMLGDNGKINDNILMHILSPYPAHRSAVTDCSKLAGSSIAQRKAIIIYGYEAPEWPLEPAISAFESLATAIVALGPRLLATFHGLVHPVHTEGAVFGWELVSKNDEK